MSDNLIDKTAAFVEAFNAEDLDAIMSFFADDGVFVGLDGTEHKGADRVRAALGATLGGLRFEDQDTFADLGQGKVLAQWRLHITHKGEPVSWQGLDILHWRDGELTLKSTYAKARSPQIESSDQIGAA